MKSTFKCVFFYLYQNMPNLHNRYKSPERKISQKNPLGRYFNTERICMQQNNTASDNVY